MRIYNKKCLYCDSIFQSNSSSKNHCCHDCSFHDKYIVNEETGCWDWMGHIANDGTIAFKVEKLVMTAPKYSYKSFKGDVSRGKFVLHSCPNNICVNPDHLFSGDNANSSHKSMLNKQNKYDEAIKSDKRPNAVICYEYRISESTLRRIRRGER